MKKQLFKKVIVALALTGSLAGATLAADSHVNPSSAAPIENQSLQKLYQDAIAEGGNLVVWAGGDADSQLDEIRNNFKKYFPEINLTVKVDVSKFLDARIDNQLARNNLDVDLVQLQTLHDFEYWKQQGVLMNYKPAAWEQVPEQFKDKDGAYTGIFMVAFSTLLNTDHVSADNGPRDATDFLDPKYKGKLILTNPTDDDAVLYQFKLLVKKYGWEYLDKLMAQEPKFVRGTAIPWVAIADGSYTATFTTAGPLTTWPGMNTTFLLPKEDEFVSWAQTAAIFKDAKNPAAAKLYLNWLLSENFQKNWFQWPIRKDVQAQGGFGSIFEHNTNPAGFAAFMKDRAGVERFRLQLLQVIGEPTGSVPLKAIGEYYMNKK